MNAHISEHICADSVVVITRRCQRLNPGSSPGRRTLSFRSGFLLLFCAMIIILLLILRETPALVKGKE
jgi:hypothetical protein